MTGKRLKLASIGLVGVMFIMPVFAAGSLRISRMTSNTDAPGLKYSCSYPHLSGIQDDSRQQRLNVRFREIALTAKLSAELAAKHAPQGSLEGSYDYEIERNQGGILSLMLNGTLTRGGRTAATSRGVTVDTVSGATYKLGDLFFDGADYISLISDKVRKQISLAGLDKKMLRGFREINANENFYLTSDALVIILGPDYFPEDMTVQKFTITLKSLEGSLNPSLRLST